METVEPEKIHELLVMCEQKTPYVFSSETLPDDQSAKIEKVTIDGNSELIVISDLHIAAGKMADGNYSGTENFFADDAFSRFLTFVQNQLRERAHHGVLIINGDFVDLLRVMRVPRTEEELDAWKKILDTLGVINQRTNYPFTRVELKNSIGQEEVKFGLKTNDYKSIWKLAAVVEGHREVFNALAGWLKAGHELIVTKGNHDLEWFWHRVRDYLRLILGELVNPDHPAEGLQSLVGRVRFFDDALVINGRLYIEHGQRYDRWTKVIGKPTLGKFDDKELNIPMGSFTNRYILNQLEETYPFIDNVRPSQDVLPLLMRENLPLGLRVLRQSVYTVGHLIPKMYLRYFLQRTIPFLLGIIVPLLLVAVIFFQPLYDLVMKIVNATGSIPFFDKLSSAILLPVLGYFWMKITAALQLGEPDSLEQPAYDIGVKNADYTHIVMGHTHNPEQAEITRKNMTQFRYFNTGTWIPIFETSTADIREDKTYTYLHFEPVSTPGGKVEFETSSLLRWNDDALRSEDLTLISKK
jgi:UDP-2,3-diacylglucosamine pyrophosphatase LpxH